MDCTVVDAHIMREIGSYHVNPSLSFIAVTEKADPSRRHYILPEWGGLVHQRVRDTAEYSDALLQLTNWESVPENSPTRFWSVLVQAEDCPTDVRSISWQSQDGWTEVQLIPDLYYYRSHGYTDFMRDGHPDYSLWADRNSRVFWRGSTTGLLNITPMSLEALPRYKLCLAAKDLGEKVDIGFTTVVQAASPEDHKGIFKRLEADGVLKPFIQFEKMASYKFIVDIDGNASSWNLIAKLLLGACILKVDSSWRQWVTDRLVPWKHYVPVKADLRDLRKQIEWCLLHDNDAQEIAFNARTFALEMKFDTELARAAEKVGLAAERIG